MMSAIATMLTCRWSARRLQRYLDADPAAPLQPADMHRLESHLAICRKCAAAAEEYRGVRRSLLRWSQRQTPDPAMVMRVRLAAERMLVEDVG